VSQAVGREGVGLRYGKRIKGELPRNKGKEMQMRPGLILGS